MTRFDTSVHAPDPAARRPILAVLDAALDAVEPPSKTSSSPGRNPDRHRPICTRARNFADIRSAPLPPHLRRRRRQGRRSPAPSRPYCRTARRVVTKYDHASPPTLPQLHSPQSRRSRPPPSRRSRRPRRQRDACPRRAGRPGRPRNRPALRRRLRPAGTPALEPETPARPIQHSPCPTCRP